MSVQVLYQADILLDGVAASTDMNRVKFNLNQQTKQVTAFGDVARHFLPGIYEAQVDGDFYYQSGLNMVVNELEAEFPGGASAGLPLFSPAVITVSDTQAVGGLTHIVQGADASAEHTGQHGEVLKGTFKFNGGSSQGRAVMGLRLLRGFNSGTSGLGTPQQLGAVSATQAVYAAMHILGTTGSGSGAVLSIISSATSGMTSPTTRITFASGTSARLGEWQSIPAGAITDIWWAAKWVTFAGASGFTASISAGIQ